MQAESKTLRCGCTRQEEMDAHDDLPAAVRAALTRSPFPTCARQVDHELFLLGEREYLRRLERAERQLMAGSLAA